MLRLTAVLIAAIYVTLAVFGQPTGPAIEVTRAPSAFGGGLLGLAPATAETAPAEAVISAADAVELALAAGDRPAEAADPAPEPAAAGAAVAAAAAPEAPVWYVTGSRVNFRAGPSTGEPVVGQLAFGDAAEVLGETGGSWIRVRSAEGREGYISARFLSPDAPRG